MKGIRSRLLLLLGSLIVVVSAIQFGASFSAAMAQTNRLFDAQIRQIALSLRQTQGAALAENKDFRTEYDLVIQVWRADQVTVYQERLHRLLPLRAGLGFSTESLDNGDWRIFATSFDGGVVQVAQKLAARRAEAVTLALHTLWPMLLMSFVLLAAMWWSVGLALRPLAAARDQIAQRDAHALDQVDCADAPHEIAPLLKAINDLLARVRDTIALQRQFVADAAHELRSPLTVLQMQIQMLGREQPEQARKSSLAALAGAIARSSRMVEQLLGLARQDALNKAGPDHVGVDLIQFVSAAIAEVAGFAAAKHIDLSFLEAAPVTVQADADSLMILLRNVLDNAVRYTPPDGAVTISVEQRGAQGVLTIADSGPGIAPADLARVTDRFYRVPGNTENGSGLGLSIVQAVVEHIGAQLSLRNSNSGGLVVKVYFVGVAA